MRNGNKGSALAMTLIVLTVLAILGTSLLAVASSSYKQAIVQEKNTKYYYAARSGADAMASYIIRNPSKVQNLITKMSTTPGTGTIDGNQFEINVNSISTFDNILVTSKSFEIVNGNKNYKSQVRLNLRNEISQISNLTLFSNQAPDLGNNVEIYGNLYTNAVTWTYDTSHFPNYPSEKAMVDARLSFQPIDQSLFSGTYSDSYRMKDGDRIFNLVNTFTDDTIKNLSWDPTHISGKTSEIHLFVTGSIQIQKLVDPPEGIYIYLYYNGTNPVTVDNGTFEIHHCSIYAPFASFVKNGGGNGTFEGILIVNSCVLPNSNSKIKFDTNIKQSEIIGSGVYKREIWGN